MRFAIGIVACVLFCSVAVAAEKMYWMGRGRGVLVLNVPDAWDDWSRAPDPGSNTPAQIAFSASENERIEGFFMRVEPLRPDGKDGPITTQPAILETPTRQMCGGRLLEPVEGKSVRGYWFDRLEGIPEFGQAHSGGMVAVGNVVLKVEIRRQKDSPATKLAREMLAAATIDKSPQAEASALAPASQPSHRRLTSNDGQWDLVVDAPGMYSAMDTASRDGKKRMFSAIDSSGRRTLGVFREPAVNPNAGDDATTVRDHYWSPTIRPPPGVADVQRGGTKQAATLTYSKFGTESHRHLYLVHGGMWVDVHVQVSAGDTSAIKAMSDLIASVHIEPHSAAATKPAAGNGKGDIQERKREYRKEDIRDLDILDAPFRRVIDDQREEPSGVIAAGGGS
jgi:hypothetical protein